MNSDLKIDQFHLLHTSNRWSWKMKVKIGTSPSYLVRNPYTYCFRMKVPKDLQSYIGEKELRYSSRTGYLAIAKNKARLLAGQVQKIFRLLRKGNLSLMKADLLRGVLKAHYFKIYKSCFLAGYVCNGLCRLQLQAI